jgi:hypothetical protein
LRVLPEDEDGSLRYGIDGEFSFADVLALRQEVTEIPGVEDVDITLESNVAMTLSLRTVDPEGTLFSLQRLERLPLVLREVAEPLPEPVVEAEPAKRKGLSAVLQAVRLSPGRATVKTA